MFGGTGLYAGKTFFAIVFAGRLYFKTDESTRTEYEARGMRPFRPSARQTLNRAPPNTIVAPAPPAEQDPADASKG